MQESVTSGTSPFLIVSHPGHELRLFRWMEMCRPRVFIMSDGSGGAAVSRVHHSLATVNAAGATAGPIFGTMPDRAWYAALLAGNAAPFIAVVEATVRLARREQPGYLVSDAVDGHNPLHDLCQAVAGAAVARLAAQGMPTDHFVAPATVGGLGTPARILRLDAAATARKAEAVAAYFPLAEEVQRILAEEPGALSEERLLEPIFNWPHRWSPKWEAFGQRRVAAGRFATPISYAEHVRPMALRLLG